MMLIAYNIFYLIKNRNIDPIFSSKLPNTIYEDKYRFENLDAAEEEKVSSIINKDINPSFKDIYTNLYEGEKHLLPDFVSKYMIDIHKLVILLKILGLILFVIFVFMISQGLVADFDYLPDLLNDMSVAKVIIAFITTGGLAVSVIIILMFLKMRKTPTDLKDIINKNYILYKPIEELLIDSSKSSKSSKSEYPGIPTPISDVDFAKFKTDYIVPYFESVKFKDVVGDIGDYEEDIRDIIESENKTTMLHSFESLRIKLNANGINDLPSPLNNYQNQYSKIYNKILMCGLLITMLTCLICIIALFYFYYNQEI